ncbi:MAG: cytochrome c biogenesis protein CcdA [Flavobacteriaceae bacterium]|nr:cytochrome c biogenesis protein CcdA [Flavobacteriaceae bacterium]MDZ4148975.1 cytochrome c biogenesis protein CcdA [Flavobacteriaceae bacterium]
MKNTFSISIKQIISICLIVLPLFTQAQIYQPVKWSATAENKTDQSATIVLKATIDKGWHLYAQHIDEGGPIPTEFEFLKQEGNYNLVGETSEEKGIEKFDAIFEMNIKYFEIEAVFKQQIKLLNKSINAVEVEVTFMVCDDTKCLPPDTVSIPVSLTGEITYQKEAKETKSVFQTSFPTETVKNTNQEKFVQTEKTPLNNQGLWAIFFIAFLSGFAALLTPCVFPMIPLTVSYFTKRGGSRSKSIRDAGFYGFSIIIIYVLLGTLVTWIFGADALNILSTNFWFNLVFFAILVIFALSFLGAFEITLPSAWANSADRQADKGGVLGIFFMALALAVVSFSCTGPIVGTLLVQAASQGGLAPVVGMLGFSSALALPFMLFALFPNWLQSLPKSGGWLNSVKVTLGFLELALAFKFLSNADLVLQLHYLERETFLAIWIAIFGAMAFYLLGLIKLAHDPDQVKISAGRLSLGLATLAFTLYLIPGLWGAPLKIISGFPPPMQYSESPNGLGANVGTNTAKLPEDAEYGPQQIPVFTDYDIALAYAKKVDKPLLIDFTGFACVNCRKMEEHVWSDSEVKNILTNKVVLVSLFVDDQRKLPESEQHVSPSTGKKIKTIGNKWSDFQITKYKTNAQPYYVLVNRNEETILDPIAYMPDPKIFEDWLNKGIEQF